MPTKTTPKKYTTAPVKELLHDGSQEFELLVQQILNDLTIEQDLVKLRQDRGMSQSQVAEITGLKQPHVAKLESGSSKNIELKTLIRVALALGAAVKIQLVPDTRVARLTRRFKAAPRQSARAANQT